MIHEFDIETRTADQKWHKTNWGGDDSIIVIERAKEVVKVFKENKDNSHHVGYGRIGVRVTDVNSTLYEELIE